MAFQDNSAGPDIDRRAGRKLGVIQFSESDKSRRWQKKNPERVKQNKRKWNQANYVKVKLQSIKKQCKKNGREFAIEENDLFIPENCPYLGIKLTQILGQGRIPTNMSLDRIDSAKGYTKDNIQILSEKANRMKSDASKEELIEFAKSIISLYT